MRQQEGSGTVGDLGVANFDGALAEQRRLLITDSRSDWHRAIAQGSARSLGDRTDAN